MKHTVVGLFSDYTQIQRAVERLEAIGISSQNIDVARRQGESKDVIDEPGEAKEWVGTSKVNDNNLTRFFKSLFSDKTDDTPDRYSRVASSGHAVVTVLTVSHDEAVRVADVLDECGAINVDEQAVSSQSSYRSPSTAPVQNTSQEHERTGFGAASTENAGNSDSELRRQSHIINRSLEDDMRLRDNDQLGRTDTDSDRNRAGSSGF